MIGVPAFWCRYPSARNFGDALTPWLIRKITGRYPVFLPSDDTRHKFLVVGSIIEYATANCTVWGSGLITRNDWIDPRTRILAVRGPLTRQRALECGAHCPPVYGDPALLLPKFYAPGRPIRMAAVGVIPHYFDKPVLFARWRPPADCKLIDIQAPIEAVIDEIVGCEQILSSSLHGLIAAHAYGVPALWVKFSDKLIGDGSKFIDYLNSVDAHIAEPVSIDIRTFDPRRGQSHIPSVPQNINVSALWDCCPFGGG